MALSSDGRTVAVGGYRDNNYVGATWIFVFDGSAYQQIGNKLVGSGSVGPYGSEQGKVFCFFLHLSVRIIKNYC